jgi:glycerol-3-phosphate responsive antiterminator
MSLTDIKRFFILDRSGSMYNIIDDTNDIVEIRPRESQPRKLQIKKIKKQIKNFKLFS